MGSTIIAPNAGWGYSSEGQKFLVLRVMLCKLAPFYSMSSWQSCKNYT
ncbi:hypothetical protein RBH92_10885 [Nitrosomonas sp. sh817]|nr:hypothetical protein RBH92_10885 [Nitrosomonas sp. sh817]